MGVDLLNPDFAKVADAFGLRAERPSEIEPAVVEIPVDPNELTAP